MMCSKNLTRTHARTHTHLSVGSMNAIVNGACQPVTKDMRAVKTNQRLNLPMKAAAGQCVTTYLAALHYA